MKKVCIVYGGPSSEHEVSVFTTRGILRNIDKKKYDIYLLYIDKKLNASLKKYSQNQELVLKGKESLFKILKKLKNFDVCLIAMHGEFGEDGTFQSLLDLIGVRYTGTDAYGSRLAMDKYKSTMLVNLKLGVDIPQNSLVKIKDFSKFKNLKYPFVFKPNTLGSSVGIYFVNNSKELVIAKKKIIELLGEEVEYLIQEPIMDNLEISCGVLEKKDGSLLYLPPIEIHPQLSSFFDYDSKYVKGGSEEITPPVSISKSFSDKLSKLSGEIHKLLGCKLYSRSDFLIKKDKFYYLETNTLPGMTDTSLVPQEAQAIGMSYAQLLDFLIENSI
jgi:D-alanine-D-alanine ligase